MSNNTQKDHIKSAHDLIFDAKVSTRPLRVSLSTEGERQLDHVLNILTSAMQQLEWEIDNRAQPAKKENVMSQKPLRDIKFDELVRETFAEANDAEKFLHQVRAMMLPGNDTNQAFIRTTGDHTIPWSVWYYLTASRCVATPTSERSDVRCRGESTAHGSDVRCHEDNGRPSDQATLTRSDLKDVLCTVLNDHFDGEVSPRTLFNAIISKL